MYYDNGKIDHNRGLSGMITEQCEPSLKVVFGCLCSWDLRPFGDVKISSFSWIMHICLLVETHKFEKS